MGKLSLNTKGFAPLILLAAVAAVLVVGGTGVYVYHKNHKAQTPASVSTTAKNTVSGSNSKSSTGTNSNTSTVTSTPTTDASMFKVSQLGIEIINVPASIQDLTDSVVDGSDSTSTGVTFSTQSLSNLSSSCTADNGGFGSLTQMSGTYSSTQQYHIVFVKQFSGFWIGYEAPSAPCSSDDQAQSLDGSQRQTFGDLVTNPANLQPIN
jgi:uncharacterized protein (UPF0333 family)